MKRTNFLFILINSATNICTYITTKEDDLPGAWCEGARRVDFKSGTINAREKVNGTKRTKTRNGAQIPAPTCLYQNIQ